MQLDDQSLDLGQQLGGVRSARTQNKLDLRRKLRRCTQQVGQTLLAGDPAHEDHRGTCRVDAAVGQQLEGMGACVFLPELGVDTVMDDMDQGRVKKGIAPQNVPTHSGTHGDDCGRPLVGRPLDPG